MKLRGADYIVRIIELLEADHLFAYPGGAILPIYDALANTSLSNVLVRHEQAASLAANAYGRLKNKPGFIRHIRKNSWSKSDPYTSYDGVERFLTLAWHDQLLSKKEINKRRKENNLTIVKKLLLKKKNWKDVETFIDNAFQIENPKNVKEFVLFSLNKFIKIFRNARS